jgi:hypothetical protein
VNVGYSRTVRFKTKLDLLIASKILIVIWISEEFADRSWQVFEHFNADKHWSFTDCSSYVVMKNKGIAEAFTFDRHFSQMGFICYPN